jgi:hypothetical protein
MGVCVGRGGVDKYQRQNGEFIYTYARTCIHIHRRTYASLLLLLLLLLRSLPPLPPLKVTHEYRQRRWALFSDACHGHNSFVIFFIFIYFFIFYICFPFSDASRTSLLCYYYFFIYFQRRATTSPTSLLKK